MDCLDLCQIVRQQGRADQLGQEASPGMAEGQQADDGEATTRAWLAGLPTLLLSHRCIRHGAARAVDNKRPRSMPAAVLGNGGWDRLAEALQEGFEQADGELGAGLTGRRGTAIATGEMGAMATSRMTMEDLQQKQLHGNHRIEEAITPHGVAHGLTGGRNRLGLPVGGPRCCEALEDSRDLGYHGSSPIKNRSGAPHPARSDQSVPVILTACRKEVAA
jgi:hypothetical protein